MASYLCPSCGTRVNDEDRNCPVCGAVNYNNREVLQSAVQGIAQEHKALRKFSRGFCVAFLIIGIAFAVLHLGMLFSIAPSFSKVESFLGAVAGATAAVFSVIGMARDEDVTKIVGISAGASLFLLVMTLVFVI